MHNSILRIALLALVVVSVAACQQQPTKKSTAVNGAASVAPAQSTPSARDRQIARLLSDADYALSRNLLLTPISDNAFDRYQSVLIMDPLNTRAKAGLQAISLRYIELARNSISRGQFAQAQEYLNNAKGIDKGGSATLIAETEASLKRQRASAPVVPAYQAGPNEHLLNGKDLSAKNAAILAELKKLAYKARDSGDMVIIYARNDAEGRWIYSQMRDALEDFLLRGDIRIARNPRVAFTPIL